MFVFPASIASSIDGFLSGVSGSRQTLLDEICRTCWSILLLQSLADFQRTSRIPGPVQQLIQLTRDSRREVFIAIERAAGANLARMFRIVRLIEGKRDD